MSDYPSPHPIILAPSILAGDHANLESGLRVVESVPTRWLHLDIMDGHFVPNLSFGPATVQSLRAKNQGLFFDVHLMLDNPDRYIEAFAGAGADGITIHVEPDYDVEGTLRAIAGRGIKTGIALNPGTSSEAAKPFLSTVDLILVMTVWPGFGGQSFIEDTLPTMRTLAQWRAEGRGHYRLQVDGGIDLKTAPLCKACGVDTLVAGTAFFKAADRREFLTTIEGAS